MHINQKLFDYIAACPTSFHAVAHTADILKKQGYVQLCESQEWKLSAGGRYFVTRNGSSLAAFRIPKKDFVGFMLAAAHSDSPCFKIKENAELAGNAYIRFSVEKYGGMLCASWMDRPLSVAGRAVVQTSGGVESLLVDFSEMTALIPSVAIHLNRNANENAGFNAATDMLPLYAYADSHRISFKKQIADALGVSEGDILASDLYLYNRERGLEWNGLVAAPRLDDLQCAFAAQQAFCASKDGFSVPVYCLLDNEEVGSQTKQGAASTFLPDVLERICLSLGGDSSFYRRKLANSFFLSCDNAHAVHPNHPEYADANHSVYPNRGIVIKYHASQKYSSDAVSAGIFAKLCRDAKVPVQYYANRADMPGGSTLGNIANTQISLNTVDIGLAQLAMHSALETAGAYDTEQMIQALTYYYGKSIRMEADGCYRVD
mgnify:CR=1 FL=1